MYDGSRAKLPTSAYAMSTALASRIGFWDAGPEAIGEDLHVRLVVIGQPYPLVMETDRFL